MPKPSVEMLPALLMPPAKVVVFLTAMAVAFALMLLPLSTLMPPISTPVSMMPPLKSVLLTTSMPPAPMVPVLVTPPLKVVALISMALVTPPKLVGYGPVNVTGILPRGPGGPAPGRSNNASVLDCAPLADLKSKPPTRPAASALLLYCHFIGNAIRERAGFVVEPLTL
jgi:hypothetical protein